VLKLNELSSLWLQNCSTDILVQVLVNLSMGFLSRAMPRRTFFYKLSAPYRRGILYGAYTGLTFMVMTKSFVHIKDAMMFLVNSMPEQFEEKTEQATPRRREKAREKATSKKQGTQLRFFRSGPSCSICSSAGHSFHRCSPTSEARCVVSHNDTDRDDAYGCVQGRHDADGHDDAALFMLILQAF